MKTKIFLKAFFIIVLGQGISGCVSNPPLASETEYVTTTGAQFLIDTNEGTVKYGMNYHLNKDIGNIPSYIAIFENPEPSGESLIVKKSIPPGEKDLIIQSPILSGIENNRDYNVILKLLSNGKMVTEHQQKVQFSLPQNILKQTNITVY